MEQGLHRSGAEAIQQNVLKESPMPAELHEVDRREIFFKIVRMQDEGVSVGDCRSQVVAQFDIDADDVRDIEREGIAKNWPPL